MKKFILNREEILMKKISCFSITFVVFSALLFNIQIAGAEPQAIGSRQSYQMVMENLSGTFILDVRTMAEYEFVGHPDLPNGVPNIPLKFYPSWEMNQDFVKNVEGRFKKEDVIIAMCRSGKRAKIAAELLSKAGFGKVYYMTDSFEGKKDGNGLRTVNGWKINQLPYTYKGDQNLIYKRR